MNERGPRHLPRPLNAFMVRYTILSLFIIFISSVYSFGSSSAFPGAEGFGRNAIGGRGGSVYHVTNLNDSGPGSFRCAVSQPHRTIVFDVSGVIHIKSKIKVSSYITIAGQTAPGEGITIYGDGVSFSSSNDVIVRYIRFRGSSRMGRGTCTVTADYAHDIIFDHVSISWGRWDNLHIKESKNITLQYCLIGEAIDPQRFGALFENPTNITVHHCLWINNQSRNPKAKANIEFVNNIIYNWGTNGFVGGHSAADHYQDIINNYFIAGPNSSKSFISQFSKTDHVYQRGNRVDLDKNGHLNGREVTDDDFLKVGATVLQNASYLSLPASHIESAIEAYETVIKEAGASLKRDEVDSRLIRHIKSKGKEGMIIHSEEEVGGLKPIRSQKLKNQDTDSDGMQDQ